jgi:drug/metabolite transporter (DMT)-like permease
VNGRFGRYGLELALVAVAAIWGGTFITVKAAVAHYPLYAFLAWRFGIAVVAFLVLFPKTFSRFERGTVLTGLLAGAFLTAGYIFQTWGLQGTTASKGAFITGMFVVITPVLQFAILRKPPRLAAILGVVAAVFGLWLLSGPGSGGWNAGDTRILICAFAYSGHFIVLGSLGRRHDARAMTLVQLATCAVVCGVVAAAVEHPALPATPALWAALVLTGVLASAVAFAVQTYAQRHLSPTRTALILIMEPVFGGVFGYVFAHEVLGVQGWIGAALIFGGMVLSEVLGALKPAGETRVVLEPTTEGMSVPLVEAAERTDAGA